MINSKKRIAAKPAAGEKPEHKKPKLEKSLKPKPGAGKPNKEKKFTKNAKSNDGRPGKKVFAGKGKTDEKPAEKTDWNKYKQDKKELKLKRKQTKDVYEISIEAKKLYEQLKNRRIQQKNELVDKLYKLLGSGDTLRKLIMAHDTARIVQCMLKYATPELHSKIADGLLPHAVEMAMSKYAHFCVLRMCKYGSASVKSRLVDSFMGSIVKMSLHSLASKILDHVYLSVANAQQQAFMRQEFYSELYRNSKDSKVKQLSDTYQETPNMKTPFLNAVKSNLEKLANKQLADNSLVHAVMLEYVQACGDENMEETSATLAPLTPHMLTTKEGCQAAIICFYKSSTKNRRAIIKAVKEHLVKICTHEQGHVFVVALINALDDTKATKKAIYDQLHPELQTLIQNPWGRRVIEWFISPADTNCFHPTFIASMEEGLQYSKKDKDVRRKEIFEAVQEPISTAMAEHAALWLSDGHIGLATANILRKLNDEHFSKVASALAEVVASPNWQVDVKQKQETTGHKRKDVEDIIAAATKLKRKQQAKKSKTVDDKELESDSDGEAEDEKEDEDSQPKEQIAGIEDAGIHIVLKKIIKNDKERLAQNADAITFGAKLLEHLNEDSIQGWLVKNRACFVLVNVLENSGEHAVAVLKQLMKQHMNLLKRQQVSGAQLLHKKLM